MAVCDYVSVSAVSQSEFESECVGVSELFGRNEKDGFCRQGRLVSQQKHHDTSDGNLLSDLLPYSY